MSATIKCFVCHVKTDDWRNDLRGLKSQHSCTYVTEFIKKILGDFHLMRDIDDESNTICADCLNRFEEYDWTCTMAKQYEKELYDLIVRTETLCNSEKNGETLDVDSYAEQHGEKHFVDPLTGFSDQPIQNSEIDVEDELLKVMVEPLDVLITKDKQSDDEQDNVLDSGAIENQQNDPDFNCKLEGDSSDEEEIEDDDYLPQQRRSKIKRVKNNANNAKLADISAPAPKRRGRKPKNRDEQDLKQRKKREKKTYECKDCEKTFEKLIDFVVSYLVNLKCILKENSVKFQ